MPSLFMGFGLRYKRVRIEKKQYNHSSNYEIVEGPEILWTKEEQKSLYSLATVINNKVNRYLWE